MTALCQLIRSYIFLLYFTLKKNKKEDKAMLHYIKFFNFYFAVSLGLVSIWLGGMYIVYGYALYLAFYIIGDAVLGDDVSEPPLLNDTLLRYMLYSALPLSTVIYLSGLWLVLPNDSALWQWLSPYLPTLLIKAKKVTTPLNESPIIPSGKKKVLKEPASKDA